MFCIFRSQDGGPFTQEEERDERSHSRERDPPRDPRDSHDAQRDMRDGPREQDFDGPPGMAPEGDIEVGFSSFFGN